MNSNTSTRHITIVQQPETKQFICMKWGTLYGPEYVNRLYAMVRRHSTGPIRFICLTDDTSGIRPEVECQPCPEIAIPAPHNTRGWRKLTTFAGSDNLFGFSGNWLFLDLDVVILRAIDDFFTYQPDKSFVVMQNWSQPGKNIGNTSVYRFRVGAETYLLEKLQHEYASVLAQYNNSQTFISRNVRALAYWPDSWCVLFKTHCVPAWPARFWLHPEPPQDARIVAFPGVPNPHEAVHGIWPAKAWKKCYKFIRPASWISNAWENAEHAIAPLESS
jgi:hypothetical protein